MRKTIPAVVVLVLALVAYTRWTAAPAPSIQHAVDNRTSDVEVEGAGTVVAMLPDDRKGSRHQRFLVRLESGTTILISHNIDVAPRVPTLRTGDQIAFRGEYVWNAKGGLVHWTHRDTRGSHEAGWLKHNGRTFQ